MILVAVDVNILLVRYVDARPVILHASWAVFTAQYLAGYLSGELSFYVAHRLVHANKFLWSAHRPHHSAELLTFLTGSRNHPLETIVFTTVEIIIGGLSTGTLFFVTGTALHPALAIAGIPTATVASIMDKFNPSHLPVSYRALNYIFLSGRMHQIHHSAEARHRNRNFGATTSLFD
jgi:sterol desaturase/sphingolipid hydroxylase (fatty acid hydroxylase superfamily)